MTLDCQVMEWITWKIKKSWNRKSIVDIGTFCFRTFTWFLAWPCDHRVSFWATIKSSTFGMFSATFFDWFVYIFVFRHRWHRWITDTFFEDSGDSGKSRASSTTLAGSSPREGTPSPASDWQMRPPAKRKMSTGSDSNSAGGQSGAPDVIYADIDADSQAPTQVYSFWLLYRGHPFPL